MMTKYCIKYSQKSRIIWTTINKKMKQTKIYCDYGKKYKKRTSKGGSPQVY
jgi:hypothetical protein